MRVYKVFTHDLRSPVVGGDPVWSGRLPYSLPKVPIARSEQICGAGWAACRTPTAAIQFAGLFPDGRPGRLFTGLMDGEYAEVSDYTSPGVTKLRCESILLEQELPLQPVIEELAERTWTKFTGDMIQQVFEWMSALKRPLHNEHVVGYACYEALKAQGMGHMRVAPEHMVPIANRLSSQLQRLTRQTSVNVRIQEGNNTGKRETFKLPGDRLQPAIGAAWLEPNTVWPEAQTAGAWSASRAIEHYYRNIDYDPTRLTRGLIDAYRWGMKQLVAHDKDVALFSMEEESDGKSKTQKPDAGLANRLRAEIAAEASAATRAAADGRRWGSDGAGPERHGERDTPDLWKPQLQFPVLRNSETE